VPDATWISAVYSQELEAKEPLVLERAPEICVEVLSPTSRHPAEMQARRPECCRFQGTLYKPIWRVGRRMPVDAF
jgi:Uma2 family endonuclease